jgi:dUTP pyrophosphatase
MNTYTNGQQNLECSDDDISRLCIRGYIENNSVVGDDGSLRIDGSRSMLDMIKTLIPVPCTDLDQGALDFKYPNTIDFLGEVYRDYPELRSKGVYESYLQHCLGVSTMPSLKVSCKDPDAVIPTKARPSDVGFDLTLIKVVKRFSDVTTLYDTGIAVSAPQGYYTEIVPRSSISKSGYILANGIGIIDPSYTGNLMVALTRVDPYAPPPALPFKCCQLILRKIYPSEIVVVSDSELQVPTGRGAGGFGSSDARKNLV